MCGYVDCANRSAARVALTEALLGAVEGGGGFYWKIMGSLVFIVFPFFFIRVFVYFSFLAGGWVYYSGVKYLRMPVAFFPNQTLLNRKTALDNNPFGR